MFGLENRGETLIFIVASFWPNNDHFDFAFSSFWCTKNYWWLFSDKDKQNNIFKNNIWDVSLISGFFTALFLRFGALNIFTGDRFVIWINKMTYSKQNMGFLKQFQYILWHFTYSMFSPINL